MILKNISKEVVTAQYNGKIYTIAPDEALDLQAFKPTTREEEIGMAERFEKKSGNKLQRVPDEAKEPIKPVIKAEKKAVQEKPAPTPPVPEKTQPAKDKEEKSEPKSKSSKKGGKR